MKGTHFVLDKLQNGASYVFSFLTEDSAQNYYQDPLFLRAFERVSVSVSMSAAVLGSNGCISSSYCFGATESATIIWKSHLLSFWISKSLTFKNINIDFSDMFPFSSDTFTFSNAASVTLKEIARKPLVLTVFAARRHKTSPKALSQNASQNSITQEPLILSGIVGHMVYLTWIFSVIIPQPQSRS